MQNSILHTNHVVLAIGRCILRPFGGQITFWWNPCFCFLPGGPGMFWVSDVLCWNFWKAWNIFVFWKCFGNNLNNRVKLLFVRQTDKDIFKIMLSFGSLVFQIIQQTRSLDSMVTGLLLKIMYLLFCYSFSNKPVTKYTTYTTSKSSVPAVLFFF